MSELYQGLSHSKWDCKYHVVFVPKRRRNLPALESQIEAIRQETEPPE
ncbi:MAG TPA: hypothetical protein VGZ73_06125 [Bryobacteraceae bacterium]|jgi:REP element-mobilizing transposase RayT|nr:hypothetical protein [Bryobacteraceae bacterium]